MSLSLNSLGVDYHSTDSYDSVLLKKEKIFDLSNNESSLEYVDNELSLVKRIVKSRDGILVNQGWEKSELFSAKVLKIGLSSITCECLLSKIHGTIEVREFPKIMFDHLKLLHLGDPLKIKVSFRKGCAQTEIIDGKGLGVEKDFDGLINWELLRGFHLDPPL